MTTTALVMKAGDGFEGIQEEVDGILTTQRAHVDPIEINIHHSDKLLYLGVMKWDSQISDDVSLEQHKKLTGGAIKSDGIDDLSIVGLYLLHHHPMYISKNVIIA